MYNDLKLKAEGCSLKKNKKDSSLNPHCQLDAIQNQSELLKPLDIESVLMLGVQGTV